MKDIYIIWQDADDKNRMWHPVAKLSKTQQNTYVFRYTKGAKNTNFSPFPRMLDLNSVYESTDLFPFFKNRIFSKNRPEFNDFLRWTLSSEDIDPLELLALLGGEKATDNYRIVSTPIESDGKYRQKFFVSGVRYITKLAQEKLLTLGNGQELHMKYEDDNKFDQNAILLTLPQESQEIVLGYYPAYLNQDIRNLVGCNHPNQYCTVKVIQMNEDAPSQYKLFCSIEAPWKKGFIPFKGTEYKEYFM